MSEQNKLNKEKTPFYIFARMVAAVIYTLIFRTKARGLENFPQDENCIILANHISGWDPITVARYYRVSEIHFMAKEDLYKIPVLRTLLKWLHAFRVNRGESDMSAMREAMQVLKDGHVLGIFPEGHRQHENRMQHIETGVAVMAIKSTVPVVPVMITGRYRFFGRVRMVVGKPIPLDDLRAQRANSDTLEVLKARIIDAVEALRPLGDF